MDIIAIVNSQDSHFKCESANQADSLKITVTVRPAVGLSSITISSLSLSVARISDLFRTLSQRGSHPEQTRRRN